MPKHNSISISFAPVMLEAFESRSADVFDYDAAEADGIFCLRVTPEIAVYNAFTHRYLRLDCRYDPGHLPRDVYELPKGDEQLRNEITRHLAGILPVEPGGIHFDYAGYGQQSEGLIVMEANHLLIDRIDAVTSHEWIELISHPQIMRLALDGKDLKTNSAALTA
jgi:hypothetical protein